MGRLTPAKLDCLSTWKNVYSTLAYVEEREIGKEKTAIERRERAMYKYIHVHVQGYTDPNSQLQCLSHTHAHVHIPQW